MIRRLLLPYSTPATQYLINRRHKGRLFTLLLPRMMNDRQRTVE